MKFPAVLSLLNRGRAARRCRLGSRQEEPSPQRYKHAEAGTADSKIEVLPFCSLLPFSSLSFTKLPRQRISNNSDRTYCDVGQDFKDSWHGLSNRRDHPGDCFD